MNRYLILMLLLCCAIVKAEKIAHPSLFYTPERIKEVKKHMADDQQMQKDWAQILEKSDEQLKRNDIAKADYLALAYMMTGDKRYSNKAKEVLLNAVKAESWSNAEMMLRNPPWKSELAMAHKSFAIAVVYDVIYNELTPDERMTIAKGMERLALRPALEDWLLEPTRIHSLNSMGHNWWTSCVCMGGILALSLQNELPYAGEWATQVYELLPEWFMFEGDVLQQKVKNFDEAGGMYESLNYANYAIQEALIFFNAWVGAHPKEKFIDIPQLLKLPNYFSQVCYPSSETLNSLNFGDSHKRITAESSLLMLLALNPRLENKLSSNDYNNALWYINSVAYGQPRDGFLRNTPMGFVFTPDLKQAPIIPSFPTAQLFSDFGWATMRTSWEKNASMLAVKSGHTWNHSHADANSFILFHKGVDIIKDAGNCWYPNPEYRNYFFQSEAHNVVLFDGKGQRKEQQYAGSQLRGYLHHLLNTDRIKYILANGTGPMADQLSRNFRHFLWIDNVIYIIDDLKSHTVGKFEWLWHPGGEFTKNGPEVSIVKEEAAVIVKPLFPYPLVPSGFVHDYPNDYNMEEIEAPNQELKETEKYFTLKLPMETNRVKAVTAIILKDSVKQRELPLIERRQGQDWLGMRVRSKGTITDIYINQLADGRLMHMNSWIEADGWSTDAYMFAVTYPETGSATEPTELFISYGSALRRGEERYFSSLSKLYMAAKVKGEFKAVINGQSLARVQVRMPQKPTAVTINDVKENAKYVNRQVVFQLNTIK